MSTAIAVPNQNGIAVRHELDVVDVIAQVQKIQRVMEQVMKEGEHYGVIPGTNKPTLLKPGAEKLLLTFRFDPQYESTETYEGKHLTIKSKCVLWHITTGMRMGSGEGSCSTKESKYAYRKGQRVCPDCGKDTIIKGKAEYGGGWLCFGKKGGCGQKWKDGDAAIEGQSTDRVPNEDLPDQYNTVLKMANKRALVAAVLNVTAASDIFTQDMEDAAHEPAREADGLKPNARPTAAESGAPVAREAQSEAELVEESHELFPDPEHERLVTECGRIIKDALTAKKIVQKDVREMKKTYLGAEDADPTKCDVAALGDLRKYLAARFEKASA